MPWTLSTPRPFTRRSLAFDRDDTADVAVFWLADQLRGHPLPGPTPVTPPLMVGTASYETTWFSSDQVSLLLVGRQYALTPRETQKYATVKYLD